MSGIYTGVLISP